MPVKTTIDEKDFSNILLDYDIGEYEGYETFGTGAGQTTMLLKTTQGKFVLRYYENRTEKHVAFEARLINVLKEKQYPTPAIVKDRSGNFWGIYKGKPRIITENIEGEHGKNPNDVFKKEEVAKVVEVIARLHNLTENLNSDMFKDRLPFDAEYCLNEYYKQSRTIGRDARGAWLKDELEKLELPDDMPQGVCHADVNYGNFLFKDGKIVAVLDFDMSFYFYLIYDIADLIYWWAFPPKKGMRYDDASFLVNQYAKHRALSETEQKHIFDALKLIILLGISWSEESDFESEKEKIEFLNTIGRDEFHKKLFI